jgi:hypothetical protein
MSDDIKWDNVEPVTLKDVEWGILLSADGCKCEKCQAWYEWFDSDRTDIENAPEPCGKNVVGFINFRPKDKEE